jgi:hypothetical protein
MNSQRFNGNSKYYSQLIKRRIFCTWLWEFHSLLVVKKKKQKWNLAGTYMRHMRRKVFIWTEWYMKKLVIFLCGHYRKVEVYTDSQHEMPESGQYTGQVGRQVKECLSRVN